MNVAATTEDVQPKRVIANIEVEGNEYQEQSKHSGLHQNAN
jgi:hypothetical protein